MKTISKLTGTENGLTNFAAAAGIILVAFLVCSFTVMAIQNGIKSF